MSGTQELRDLQEWMSIVIEHRRDAAAGARTNAAREIYPVSRINAGEVVVPNDRMAVYERLDVYNGGYFARLKEVLESDFPALIHALGEHDWFHLALGYLTRHPSRHPSLNQLNRNLPRYIANRNIPHRAFLRDLAELEVRMSMAFDAPEFTPKDMETLLDVTPEQWTGAVFEPNPSLQLHRSSYPINHYLQMVFDERDPPPVAEGPPKREKTFLAIYRKDYKVWRLRLPRPMFLILESLCDGQPLGEAIAAGGEHNEDFQHWFREWSADGLFTDVRY